MIWTLVAQLFASPVSKWVGIALAILTFISWQRHDAAQDATAKAREQCRIEVQERTEAEIERQRKIAETVLNETRKQKTITESELADMRKKADELLRQLDEKSRTCPLDPDTVRRLREIR